MPSAAKTFRPWGYPVFYLVVLLGVFFVNLAFAPPFTVAVTSPLIVVGIWRFCLTLALEVSLGEDTIDWRTVLYRDGSSLKLLMEVTSGTGYAQSSIRMLHFADGSVLRMGNGAAFDSLIRSLRTRGIDFVDSTVNYR